MTWVIWTLVPMVHTPRGRSGAIFVEALAQSECGQFCHFGICGPNWDRHHAEWHGDFWEPREWESLLVSWWIAYGMANPISKPAWRYTIESTPNFGSFQAAKMTQFWDPNPPFRVVNWRPHSSKPIGSPDLNSSCTLRYESQVLPPTL